MKPIKLNYSAFEDLDIFLTHSNHLVGRIIRTAETENTNFDDDKTPTHGGFSYIERGQVLALQMNPRLVSESLEQYTGRREQIVEVWRCRLWTRDKKEEALDYLSYLRRKSADNTKYDLWGAIKSSPLGNSMLGWLPWVKNSPGKWFCTECVGTILSQFVDSLCPKSPDPLDLSRYFQSRGEENYYRVPGWKQ
jgi:hypothetical protein